MYDADIHGFFQAQYTFAHAAILEHIKYGDTEVSVKKFRNQVQNLR